MDENVRQACIDIALEEVNRSLQPQVRQPMRDGGETGAEYITRLLTAHPMLCQEQLRLSRDIFLQLESVIIERGLLKDGRFISVREQIAIALYILAKGASYRDVADIFKHSTSSISKYFRLVLNALVQLSPDIIRPHTDFAEVPEKIANSQKYWPFFKDCIGAIDGTHINAVIADEKGGNVFRNRKGYKSWNVLACISFDLLFTYVNVGWEGSAHDQRVWLDSLNQSKYNFPHPPPGKYYLVDSGYPTTLGYLAPISDKNLQPRYHSPEFRRGGAPEGIEEHFNYRHSSLRNGIERAFGILKQTWQVLDHMSQMEDKYQMSIIVSTFTLHNFMRLHKLGIPITRHNDIQGTAVFDMFNTTRKSAMLKVRRKIAKEIWLSLGETSVVGYESDDNEMYVD